MHSPKEVERVETMLIELLGPDFSPDEKSLIFAKVCIVASLCIMRAEEGKIPPTDPHKICSPKLIFTKNQAVQARFIPIINQTLIPLTDELVALGIKSTDIFVDFSIGSTRPPIGRWDFAVVIPSHGGKEVFGPHTWKVVTDIGFVCSYVPEKIHDPFVCSYEQCQNKATPDNSLKMCTGCKSARYCSKECQKAAWPIHKSVCKHLIHRR